MTASERILGFALPTIRILLGLVCFANGFNWFFKIITPYPSMSDFVHFMPPPDIVGALIENGILFHLVKVVELVAGIALLTNRFVPLALVVSMSVTVIVFIVDVFRPGPECDKVAEAAVKIRPRAVWLQLGITNGRAKEIVEGAGIQYIEDKCLRVEHRRVFAWQK